MEAKSIHCKVNTFLADRIEIQSDHAHRPPQHNTKERLKKVCVGARTTYNTSDANATRITAR